MATQQQKNGMMNHVARLMQDSGHRLGNYDQEHIDVTTTQGASVRLLLLHSKQITDLNYTQLAQGAQYVAPVFRHGDFHKYLNDVRTTGRVKGSLEALHDYTPEQRTEILSLQGLEKRVLKNTRNYQVPYYFENEHREQQGLQLKRLPWLRIVPGSIDGYDFSRRVNSDIWSLPTNIEKPNNSLVTITTNPGQRYAVLGYAERQPELQLQ